MYLKPVIIQYVIIKFVVMGGWGVVFKTCHYTVRNYKVCSYGRAGRCISILSLYSADYKVCSYGRVGRCISNLITTCNIFACRPRDVMTLAAVVRTSLKTMS